MNKIIPFNKDITFNDKIGEIESIALDDTLKFTDEYSIKGELIVRGCNKYNEIEEEFSYALPVEIAVDNKYDTKKASISIDDFYYEIINENILRVKIDLILDDLYYKEEKIDTLTRDVSYEKEKSNNLALNFNLEKDNGSNLKIDLDLEKEKKDNEKEEKKDVMNLFKEGNNPEEKEYSIYRVYLVGDNDTLESILNKYKVTKEDLEDFNDLSNIVPGVKLIIPSTNE